MVGVLIRMKLRVLSHSLGGARAASFAMGALVGLIAGVVSLRLIADNGTTIAAGLFLLWTIGWILGPIIMGGGDETLRAENFSLLPLSPTKLAFGLLGASLAGVPPVATAIAFLGLVFGAWQFGVVPTVVAVIAVVLALGFTVLLSRVIIAALGAVLGSRRGKDLGVLLAALAGLSYLPLRYAAAALNPLQNSPSVGIAVRLLPTGWAPAAVEGAATGNWLVAIGALAALAIVDGALLWMYARLLIRRLTVRQTSVAPVRHATAGSRTARTPVGAVIGKELRLWWRDVRRRVALLTSVLIGLFIPVFSANGLMLPFTTFWVVAFSILQVSNLYGFDGTSLWHTIVTPGAARADIRGRQWAWALIVGPLAVVAAAVLPGVTGHAGVYPLVLGVLPALLGGGAGFIVLLSVYWPFPLPRGNNPFGMSGRPGFSRGIVRLLSILVLAVCAVPSLIVLYFGGGWIAVPVGVLVGVGTAWQLGKVAENRLLDRGPELLARLGA